MRTVGVEKDTRTCKRCHREMNKFKFFYTPTTDVCIACNPDVKFIQATRRIARQKGMAFIEDRLKDYERRAQLTREVIELLRRTNGRHH